MQYVESVHNDVAHSSVVALRNLAEDLENKKVIAKYGMQNIVSKVRLFFKVQNFCENYFLKIFSV